MEMGHRGDQDFIRFNNIQKRVGETLYDTAPRSWAYFRPCFRHEIDPLNRRSGFLKKAKPQSRQLMIIEAYRLIQFDIGR